MKPIVYGEHPTTLKSKSRHLLGGPHRCANLGVAPHKFFHKNRRHLWVAPHKCASLHVAPHKYINKKQNTLVGCTP